ncbi:CGNR zinc finger domain-containing protein [Nocardia sp. NPDC051030]|uniref:CGNR zinc finger domain-containing protein n=1 Tax=Nocardia sp. NPDC051030 TaxID=3155162 RepID=UPI0034383BFC
MPNPRPHLGEPLALDLLNTRWIAAEGPQDLLTDVSGLRQWLTDNELTAAADDKTLKTVLTAREAILHTARGESTADLNTVLDHGRIRRTLTPTGPADIPETRHPEWFPAWLAADNLLHLLAAAPDRIKQCAHPDCVLWFYDTSKNGTRRWHSMLTCGNRAKATRHYARKTHPR